MVLDLEEYTMATKSRPEERPAEERPDTAAARDPRKVAEGRSTARASGSDTPGAPEKQADLDAPPSLLGSPAEAQPSDTGGGGEKQGGGLGASSLVDELAPGPAEASSSDTGNPEKQTGGLDASKLVED